MHGEGIKMKGQGRAKGSSCLENRFDFYAPVSTGFSLRLWHVRRRWGRRYARKGVTVLTTLTIQLLWGYRGKYILIVLLFSAGSF